MINKDQKFLEEELNKYSKESQQSNSKKSTAYTAINKPTKEDLVDKSPENQNFLSDYN